MCPVIYSYQQLPIRFFTIYLFISLKFKIEIVTAAVLAKLYIIFEDTTSFPNFSSRVCLGCGEA